MKRPAELFQGPRLLDVLAPPANPWLRRGPRSGRLPEGIRVVRHSSDKGDDDEVGALAALERRQRARARWREFAET